MLQKGNLTKREQSQEKKCKFNQPGSANCHRLGASDHPWCSHFQ
jgi:hypothetical protein